MTGRAGQDRSVPGNSQTECGGAVVVKSKARDKASRSGPAKLGASLVEAGVAAVTLVDVPAAREVEPAPGAALASVASGGRLESDWNNACRGGPAAGLAGASCSATQPQANASSRRGRAKGRIEEGNRFTAGSALFHFEDDAVHMKVHRPFLHRPQHLRRGIAKSHEVHRFQPGAKANREPIGTGLAD